MKRTEFLGMVWTGLAAFSKAYDNDPERRDLDLSEEEWAERLNNFGEDDINAPDKQPTDS